MIHAYDGPEEEIGEKLLLYLPIHFLNHRRFEERPCLSRDIPPFLCV
jgi:hypothetical protein